MIFRLAGPIENFLKNLRFFELLFKIQTDKNKEGREKGKGREKDEGKWGRESELEWKDKGKDSDGGKDGKF